MRKLFFIAGLALAVSSSYGQKLEKLDDVKEKISKGKYDEAKEKLDKVFENPQAASNSEALFYKAVVYQNLAKEKKDTALSAAALDAMTKYMKMEETKPEAQQALLSTLENHKTLVDIYQTDFNDGIENFKNNNFGAALGRFEGALAAFDLLSKKNLVKAPFDTTVTLYAGYSAQNAKMYDAAAKHYQSLIDHNVNDTSYVGIYRFMINSNLDKKDTATAKKYLAISETRFPQYGDTWLEYKTLFLPEDKTRRFAEYETLVKANPTNEALAMNYAIELYNNLRSSDANENDAALREKAENALKNVLTMNPNSSSANLLISQLYWTELYQIQSQLDGVRGATAAATAKKKDLNAKMDAVFEKVYPYLQHTYDQYSAMTTLKPQDKANYRIVLGQLADYYNRKKQTAKANEYLAKQKTLQ